MEAGGRDRDVGGDEALTAMDDSVLKGVLSDSIATTDGSGVRSDIPVDDGPGREGGLSSLNSNVDGVCSVGGEGRAGGVADETPEMLEGAASGEGTVDTRAGCTITGVDVAADRPDKAGDAVTE